MKGCKKFLGLLLAVVFMITLFTACNVKEETGTTTGTTAGTTKGDSTTAAPTEEVKKLEQITYVTKDYYTIPEYAQMLEVLFEEDTGIKLRIQHIPSNDWEQKLNTLFLSGDIPDVARCDNNLYPMIQQGFVIPLEDFINNNAEFKVLAEKNPDIVDAFTLGENVYAVTQSNAKVMAMWVRESWLKTLNIGFPKTMDELEAMLVKFRDSDLDGNNTKDTIPLTMSATQQNHDLLAASFGTRNEVFQKDGKFIDPILTPEYKEYLEWYKKMYSNGLIDLEVPTNTSYGAVRTKFNTGQAGAIIMWDDIYDTLKKGLTSNNIEDEPVYIPPFEGKNGGMFGFSYYSAESPLCITSSCEYPKETFDAFFSWVCLSDNGIIATSRGIEGYSFDVVDGVMVPNADNNGVGFRGQSLPPVNRDFEYPYKFDEITQREYDGIREMAVLTDQYADKVKTIHVPLSATDYHSEGSALREKIRELFYSFIMNKMDYQQFTDEYNKYKKEIGLDAIIENMNK